MYVLSLLPKDGGREFFRHTFSKNVSKNSFFFILGAFKEFYFSTWLNWEGATYCNNFDRQQGERRHFDLRLERSFLEHNQVIDSSGV